MINLTEQHLVELRLDGMRAALTRRLKQAQDDGLGLEEFLGLLLQDELEHRKNKRLIRPNQTPPVISKRNPQLREHPESWAEGVSHWKKSTNWVRRPTRNFLVRNDFRLEKVRATGVREKFAQHRHAGVAESSRQASLNKSGQPPMKKRSQE